MSYGNEHKVRVKEGEGITGNPEFVGVGALVGSEQCVPQHTYTHCAH